MPVAPRFLLQRTQAKPLPHAVAEAGWILCFAAATALGARVEIPAQPIPFTLQTFVVLLSGAMLGARNGFLSQVLYLTVGILGAPVFAGPSFGLARLLGPSGGYLIAFPLAAALVGLLVTSRGSLVRIVLGMGAGLAVIFLCGTLQLYALYLKNVRDAVTAGLLIFSWWDLLKLAAAAMIYRELGKRWPVFPA